MSMGSKHACLVVSKLGRGTWIRNSYSLMDSKSVVMDLVGMDPMVSKPRHREGFEDDGFEQERSDGFEVEGFEGDGFEPLTNDGFETRAFPFKLN